MRWTLFERTATRAINRDAERPSRRALSPSLRSPRLRLSRSAASDQSVTVNLSIGFLKRARLRGGRG